MDEAIGVPLISPNVSIHPTIYSSIYISIHPPPIYSLIRHIRILTYSLTHYPYTNSFY